MVAGLDVERPVSFSTGFETGPGGTVALENVDARAAARTAARTATCRGAPTKQRPAAPRQRARTELSLAERLLLVLQPPLEALLEPDGLLEWPAALYPYQYEGVQALVESEALLLADDMGLGKTIQAIAAIRVLVHPRRADQVLIVVPASLVTQWRREFETWAPELRVAVVRGPPHDRLRTWRSRAHVFITGYETLLRDFDPIFDAGPHKVTWTSSSLTRPSESRTDRPIQARSARTSTGDETAANGNATREPCRGARLDSSVRKPFP